MKKLSRLISAVLALCMLLTCFSVPAYAAEETTKKSIEDYPEFTYAMDASDKKSIEAVKGLKADTKNTNENKYSAKWAFKDVKQLSFNAIRDINGFETVEFYMYGDEAHPASLLFTVWANNPDTTNSDYYNAGEFVVKPGWNKYTFSLSEIKKKAGGNPKPFTDIESITLWATGWGLENKNDFENTVLYIDSLKLIRGEKLIEVPKEVIPEEDAGNKKYFELDFEAEKAEDIKTLQLVPKTNKIELKNNGDNKYISIQGLATEDDGFFNINNLNSGRYVVIRGDFMVEKIGSGAHMALKDKANIQEYVANISRDGSIMCNAKKIGTAEEGKWFNLAICMDLDNHTYAVYLNGEEKEKDIKMTQSEMGHINMLRCYISKGTTVLNIDNLVMFDGKTLEDYENAVTDEKGDASSVVAGESIDITKITKTPAYLQVEPDAVKEVADAVCLKVNSPFALVRHKQMAIDENNRGVAPFVINGRTLVPVRFIAESFGAEVGWDNDTRTVTVKKDNDFLTLAIGSNILNKNGEDITIDVPAEIYNDRTMLPLRAVTENLGKKVFWDDMGLIIISDEEINFTKEKDLDKMLDIMAGFTYERPGEEKIKADILKNSPNHPRLLANAEDFERIRNLYATDENMQWMIADIMKAAERYVVSAPSEAEHTYASDVGGRLANTYEIQQKAFALGMAYQLTGDKKYSDAIWYTLKDMCDRAKWQHWHPGHFLNAADVMVGVAIAYDWMYDAWTPEQKTIIEEALFDCGLEDSITAYHDATDYLSPPMSQWHRSGWWKQGNNWNPGSNYGVMIAGVAMASHEKYGEYAIKCIDYALNGIEVGLRCYAPDGGYEEGVGYWGATNLAIMLMEAINKAAGSDYGLSSAPGFNVTYATPLYMESKIGMFNYSDASQQRTESSSFFWFAREYDNPSLGQIRFNEIKNGEKAVSYRDILWYDPKYAQGEANLPLDYKFFKTDSFTMRSSWTDQNQLFGGIHGGSNTANHCNIDSGTFVLDSLSTRWFIDFGGDNYNLDGYWSTGAGGARWQYYTQRAEGHNTFVINPGLLEEQIVKSTSPIIEFVSKPRGAYGKVDLTPAYAKNAASAIRGMMFTANRKAAVIQDEIKMFNPSEFYWFAHTRADVEIASDGRSAILTQGSKKLHVALVSDNEALKFEIMDAVSLPTSPVPKFANGQKENSRAGIRKLVIHASGVENIALAVVCQPVINGKHEYVYNYTKLSDWTVPDGEILTPTLTDIKVAGETVKNFAANRTDYEVVLPFGTNSVPEISVKADALSKYELVLPETLPGSAEIKVINNEDSTMYSVYNVFMRAAEDVEIEVSDAQDGNPGENCLDKQLETRWAVEGESWGIFHFANPKTISSVWVATWKAAERKLIFDIEVSEDGENFTQVWSGKSAIDKDELEEFKIPQGTYKAVKLVLHGTTTGAWNSLLEVEFK